MRRSTPLFAAATLVAVGVFGAPLAAQASSIYPPSGSCEVTPSATTPSSTVVFSCVDGTFAADEGVKITITGENGGGATFGYIRTAVTTGAYDATSTADGGLGSTRISLASDVSGIYNIAAVSASSAGGTASVTVSASGTGLPSTGGDGQAVALWAGGGLVLIAGGAIAIAAAMRRRRQH